MPEIPPPKAVTWYCCCEWEPPSLRCMRCLHKDHNSCADPMKATRRGLADADRS